LLASREEAEAILRLTSPHRSLKALDFRASRRELFDAKLDDFRILHFATHGLLNSSHPELSGLVLSLVDEHGAPQNGFLRLQDIYNLRLAADLVVLSACSTALGSEVRGEGLVGLTRGFVYAGARSVLASLWKIDDEASAEFMKIFYRKILAEGLRPAVALRTAQTELQKEKRWQAPYHWAAFVLQGEW
jgi:CHAT domain-containing protein